ncbi:MAG: pentapeptide repeat-containing protein [Phycisphaerales bacterium]|nr:MAG: pentapeptide repeat-containing protein [Phycisphaerales bacterium]
MEVLTAFVRENAPWPPKKGTQTEKTDGEGETKSEDETPPTPATDVQAALTVIARRNTENDDKDHRLNLSATDLRGASLRHAHLQGADLHFAHLEGAYLQKAHLGAFLYEAHLEFAWLSKAHLEGADLYDAHLEGAIGLKQEQIVLARGSRETELPDGLTHPKHWDECTEEEGEGGKDEG